MLREIRSVRQIPGERPRRWFTDETMDLYVWQDPDDCLYGFQICYDKNNSEKALTWKKNSGFKHHCVASNADPLDQKTPILHNEHDIFRDELLQLFQQQSDLLPPALSRFIVTKLHELPSASTVESRCESNIHLSLLQKIWIFLTRRNM